MTLLPNKSITQHAAKHSSQVNKMLFAAELVQRLGNARVFSSCRLRDYFAIEGIKIWEIVEPTLAAFEIPRILDADNQITERLKYKVRSRLAQTKYESIRRKELHAAKARSQKKDAVKHDIQVLLFGFSGYMERDVIAPLARDIRDNNLSYYTIVDDNTSLTATANNTSGDHLNIWSLWNRDCEKQLSHISKFYKSKLAAFDCNAIRQLYEACESPCSLSIFSAFMKYVFHALLPHYFHHVIIAETIYSHSQVKWNISPDVSDPRVRAFCLVGRKYQTKWADIQFGIYSLESVEWIFCQSDLVFAWGEFSRSLLNNFGVPKNIIHVVGSPKFDSLVGVKSKFFRPSNDAIRSVNVLFCSMYALKSYANIPKFEETLKRVKSDVVKFAKKNPRIKLTIKLHPLEDDGLIKQLTSNDSNVVIVGGAADIRDYIKECDVFITLGSTSTIDAILLEKAVIFPNYEGLIWWDDIYLKSAVAIDASTSEHLDNLLQNLDVVHEVSESDVMRRNRKEFINNWVSFSDQKSTTKILRVTGLLQQHDSVAE